MHTTPIYEKGDCSDNQYSGVAMGDYTIIQRNDSQGLNSILFQSRQGWRI